MDDQTSYARDSCPKPSHHDNGKCLPQEPLRIRFRHPGYQDTDNVLLTLSGLDFVNGGIHHETARIACAIIANNQFHGYFTEDKEGAQRVLVSKDGILSAKDYYFHIGEQADGTSSIPRPEFQAADLETRQISNYSNIQRLVLSTYSFANLLAKLQDIAPRRRADSPSAQ